MQISEFYLVCGIVLSRATPVQIINNGIHCIFHVFLFCVFWANDRDLSKKTLLTIIIYDVVGFVHFSHLS